MNGTNGGGHPSEERLMEYAVSGGSPEMRAHIDTCDSCARVVGEFREVKHRVAALAEEEVPDTVRRRILGITRHERGTAFTSAVQSLFSNTFFIVLIVAVMVILLYLAVGTEVFKGP